MLRTVLTALVLLAAAPAAAQAVAPDPTTGRLLVTMDHTRPGTGVAAASRVAEAGGRISGDVVPALRLLTVSPRDPGGSRAALAARLRATPGVASVSVERRFTPRYVPNDPALSLQDPSPGTPPGTVVEWWAARQGLDRLWDVTRGAGARVAVIDTGIDATHPDLASKVVLARDRDDDPGTGPATVDEVGHGTHVASLACADADNAVGIAGAGLECGLLVFKSDLSESSVSRSIVEAVRAGADAINLSFGTSGATPAARPVVQALRLAHRRGVVVVAAAADSPVQEQGDPANVLQPAGSGADLTKGIGLTVTAAEQSGARAAYAGLGSQISMAAYGSWASAVGAGGPPGILGAFPAAQTTFDTGSPPGVPPCGCRTTFGGDTRYAYIQGTSMAAPVVAGAAALIKHLNPDLSADDVIRLLKQTAQRPVGTGWTPDLGWGILDAGAAGEAARVTDRTPPTSRLVEGGARRPGRRALRVRTADPQRTGLVASGISRIELWRATGRGSYHRLATTDGRTFSVRVRRGVRYRFQSVAVDRAGNREVLRRTRADVRVG